MRVLIMGCGYTGLALGSRLVREGHTVTGVVASTSSAEALRPRGITPCVADCRTAEGALAACRDEADAVVFSLSSGGGDYRDVYLGGMRHVLEALRGCEPRLFLHVGSASVYPQTDGSWVTEESPAEPSHENARILRETEQALVAGAEGRMAAFILRLGGIYGPGRHHLLDQVRAGARLLPGNGGQWTNRIHREDLVEAICFLLDRKESPSGARILNLTDDEPAPQREVVGWLCGKLGRPVPSFSPNPENFRGSHGVPTAVGANPEEVRPPKRAVSEVHSSLDGEKCRFSGDATSSPRLQTNRRISNRALRALGWRPRFPSYREGFEAILAGEDE